MILTFILLKPLTVIQRFAILILGGKSSHLANKVG